MGHRRAAGVRVGHDADRGRAERPRQLLADGDGPEPATHFQGYLNTGLTIVMMVCVVVILANALWRCTQVCAGGWRSCPSRRRRINKRRLIVRVTTRRTGCARQLPRRRGRLCQRRASRSCLRTSRGKASPSAMYSATRVGSPVPFSFQKGSAGAPTGAPAPVEAQAGYDQFRIRSRARAIE